MVYLKPVCMHGMNFMSTHVTVGGGQVMDGGGDEEWRNNKRKWGK